MASAKTYVTKFKSFVILFFTPILLLPLIILVPDKVSCVSGQPGGTRVPSAITGTETGNAELERTDSPAREQAPPGCVLRCFGHQMCPAKYLRDEGEHILERTDCKAQEPFEQTRRPGS